METFSALLAPCVGNSPFTGEFPTQRLVTWSFGISLDLRMNKRLSKQSWCWWFETPGIAPIMASLYWQHINGTLETLWSTDYFDINNKDPMISARGGYSLYFGWYRCAAMLTLFFWHSRAWTRSFWGTFSHSPTPKRSFGVLKLPILTEFDLFGPKFLDLLGSNFQCNPPPPPPPEKEKFIYLYNKNGIKITDDAYISWDVQSSFSCCFFWANGCSSSVSGCETGQQKCPEVVEQCRVSPELCRYLSCCIHTVRKITKA